VTELADRGIALRSKAMPMGALLSNVRDQFVNNTDNVCSIFGKASGGTVKSCVAQFDEAVQKNPEGLFQKVLNFAKSPGVKTFGAGAAVGTAIGLVKAFRNDDPTTYLSNEDQQKSMLVDMATQPISPDFERPRILDYQLPAVGASLAGINSTWCTINNSKQVEIKMHLLIRKEKTKRFDKNRCKSFRKRTRNCSITWITSAVIAAMDITSQIAEGDSVADIATDPFNYTYPIFAEQTDKFTRGLNPTFRKVAKLGLGKPALKVLSRAGIGGLAASLAIQGIGLLDD
jgi:hypothetical protein